MLPFDSPPAAGVADTEDRAVPEQVADTHPVAANDHDLCPFHHCSPSQIICHRHIHHIHHPLIEIFYLERDDDDDGRRRRAPTLWSLSFSSIFFFPLQEILLFLFSLPSSPWTAVHEGQKGVDEMGSIGKMCDEQKVFF